MHEHIMVNGHETLVTTTTGFRKFGSVMRSDIAQISDE